MFNKPVLSRKNEMLTNRSRESMRRRRLRERIRLLRHAAQNAATKSMPISHGPDPLRKSPTGNGLPKAEEFRAASPISLHHDEEHLNETCNQEMETSHGEELGRIEREDTLVSPVEDTRGSTTSANGDGVEMTSCCDAQDEIKMLTEKLCGCVPTTVGDVVYMVLVLGLRHGLTWTAQVDILKMFSSIFNLKSMPQSRKTLLKKVCDEDLKLSYHIFCPDCQLFLGEQSEDKSKWSAFCNECQESIEGSNLNPNLVCDKCTNLLAQKEAEDWFMICFQCHKSIKAAAQSNFFISLSLEKQLSDFMLRENVAELILNHRFNRVKTNPAALEDLYDGDEYMKHCSNGGILSVPTNFSYSFFTDGVPTGKSNGKTMWPVYVKINELPFKERMEHTFLCGLYIGNKDPCQIVFLKPFVDEANKLSSAGFNWVYNNETVNSKVIPSCAVVDSVARCQVLNMQTFHAFYGCTYCYQTQERTVPRKRRFNMSEEAAPVRTPESTALDAIQAHENRDLPKPEDRSYRGVKGPSVLLRLNYFNLILGFSVDYMHAVLLGVVKTHMSYLFEASRKKFCVGVTDRVALSVIFDSIDKRFLTVKPPSSITRTPRSIKMWKLWKASEWRAWILFYCIPCLEGLLKEKYLIHLGMLSRAMWIYLQPSIFRSEIDEAHLLLLEYGSCFQTYFQLQDTVYNLHLLSHLKQSVLSFGPLWGHNAFCYEGQNRHLLQLYASPINVLLSMARKYKVYSSLPFLVNQLVSNPETLDYCEEILDSHIINFVRAGKAVLYKLQPNAVLSEEKCNQLASVGIQKENCTLFHVMLLNGFKFTSSEYTEGKLNNNSILVTVSNVFYVILNIIKDQSDNVVLLCQKVKLHKGRLIDEINIDHIHKVKRLGRLSCMYPVDVKTQGILLTTASECFVTSMLNGCHGD